MVTEQSEGMSEEDGDSKKDRRRRKKRVSDRRVKHKVNILTENKVGNCE